MAPKKVVRGGARASTGYLVERKSVPYLKQKHVH